MCPYELEYESVAAEDHEMLLDPIWEVLISWPQVGPGPGPGPGPPFIH